MHSRRKFCRPKAITPRAIASSETKPILYAIQNERGVYFFNMNRVKVPVHKTELFLTICEPQFYYVDKKCGSVVSFRADNADRSVGC